MDLGHVQWFPGHMTKAMRMMEDNVKLVDGVIFVLDARAPFSCINETLEKKLGNRPFLYVLNKCDMVTESDRDRMVSALVASGRKVVTSVGTTAGGCKSIYPAFRALLNDKIARNEAKGIKKTLRAMVCGVPNTGKSTVINALCGKKAAQVGNKAGVTRGKQWIRLDGFELLDTPGTMPPSIDDNEKGLNLAFIGGLNDAIIDEGDLCLALIERLLAIRPSALTEKYGIEVEGKAPLAVYESICEKRGYLARGGVYDYSRCALAVIDDFRKCRLGKICLEAKTAL